MSIQALLKLYSLSQNIPLFFFLSHLFYYHSSSTLNNLFCDITGFHVAFHLLFLWVGFSFHFLHMLILFPKWDFPPSIFKPSTLIAFIIFYALPFTCPCKGHVPIFLLPLCSKFNIKDLRLRVTYERTWDIYISGLELYYCFFIYL